MFVAASGRRLRWKGFTLAEGLIGLGVLSLFLLICFTSISFNRVAATKAKEEAIVMDFLVHYTEAIKGMDFNDVAPGRAVNPLFDGTAGSPDIRIPLTGAAVPVNTTNYEMFHPDLLWLHRRNPAIQVIFEKEMAGAVVRSKHLNVKLTWDAPLKHGARQEAQVDLVRVKDL